MVKWSIQTSPTSVLELVAFVTVPTSILANYVTYLRRNIGEARILRFDAVCARKSRFL